jgi:tripartite ATP-independent transporter DctM subunit
MAPRPPIAKQSWGEPLQRFDRAWTRLESRLAAFVLVAEIAALCLWIVLKGLSAEYQVEGAGEKNISGLVFRSLLTACVLGCAIHRVARPSVPRESPAFAAARKRQRILVTSSVLGGLLLGRLWANAGVPYFSNLLNWMQSASLLMLLGGLRGVATRLTLWLALLGGSIATAKGKHINIDVVMRFLTPRARVPVAVLGWVAAAVVCTSGAWGFVDHIEIALFHGRSSEACKDDPAKDCPVPASEKLGHIAHGMATDLFLVGRQLSLDVHTLPRVLVGRKYNESFTSSEWNAWVASADWSAHFPADAATSLLAPAERPDDKHAPAISIPGGEEVRGLLIKDADFVFPFGLLMMALRFLLRSLLVLAGYVRVDPDLAHEEEGVERSLLPEGSPLGSPLPHSLPAGGEGGQKEASTGAKVGLSAAFAVVVAIAIFGGVIAAGVVALALLGTPLFAIMGGASELAWLFHPDPAQHFLNRIAPTVLDEERFAGSPILVTIPLFTFVGYVMAESKTPDRIVRASRAFFGWMPGGLAVVCIVASAFFTTLTGGSGVTIVAIGGLLYPALRKQGYSDAFSLGLVTTGGSLGLLLPPSLPILVYSLVAGIDFNQTFKAGLLPGFLVMAMLGVYAAYVGKRENVKLERPRLEEMARALWMLKWELLIPVIILGGLATGLTELDESAGLAAFYTLVVEIYVYKDLSLKKDLPRIAKESMGLAGAVILILAMANALINYVVQQSIPCKVLDAMLQLGLTNAWQFLIVMNVFLLVLGMLMDGFSAILVAVPLILPFAARFALGPFHMAMIFLLNLEIAYCCPPLGLNLFISSFRFNRPVVSLYRIVLPFTGILAAALILVTYVPAISDVLVRGDIAAARAKAAREGGPPREAWLLECVQNDRSNPLPCTEADKQAYPGGQARGAAEKAAAGLAGTGDAGIDSDASGGESEDDLLLKMLGHGKDAGG